MSLNWLLTNYLRQMAAEKVRETVTQAVAEQLRGQGAAGQEPDAAGCDEAPADQEPSADVGVVFALGLEAGGLEDLAEGLVTTRGRGFVAKRGKLKGRQVVMIRSGAGRAAAAKATEALLVGHEPAWVVSAGFAGGLAPKLKRYHVVMADRLLDLDGGRLAVDLQVDPASLAETPGVHVGPLLTADRILRDPAEKRALGEAHQALAVDMETFAVAEVCRRRGVRMLAVRIITDTVDDELPRDVEKLLAQQTTLARLGAVAGALWNRPSRAKDLWQLRETALVASDRLAKFLASVLAQLPRAGSTEPQPK